MRRLMCALCCALITGCETTTTDAEAEAEHKERVYNPRTKTYTTAPDGAPAMPGEHTLQSGRLIR